MFYDAQQLEQALAATRPQQQPSDPVREAVAIGAAFMLGRSVARLFQKQAADATQRCW